MALTLLTLADVAYLLPGHSRQRQRTYKALYDRFEQLTPHQGPLDREACWNAVSEGRAVTGGPQSAIQLLPPESSLHALVDEYPSSVDDFQLVEHYLCVGALLGLVERDDRLNKLVRAITGLNFNIADVLAQPSA